MANSNIPSGITPINENGTPWNSQGRMVAFASNLDQQIFKGDPLVPTGVTDGNGVPYVELATAGAGGIIQGGFIGRSNGPAGSGVTLLQNDFLYVPANVVAYGLICDDQSVLYAVQEDSVGGAIAAANAGFSNGNLVSGAGNVNTGLSGWQLQSSSVGSGNPTYQVKVLGLLRGPDNALGVNAKWVVRLNESVFNAPSAGI